MSEGKRKLWDLTRATMRSSREGPALTRVSRAGELPLSFAQQRLWFLEQLSLDSAAYNESNAFHLEGPLELTKLEQSLNELARRHEILRTSFPTAMGKPCLQIAAEPILFLTIEDLRALPEKEREAEVHRLTTIEAQTPFDLATCPLWRVKVLCQGEALNTLILTNHHIIWDQWSLGLFMRELVAIYDAFAAFEPPPLAEPSIQYVDFAFWQRERMSPKRIEEQLGYWRAVLDGAPEFLELPSDRSRPPVQGFEGGTCWFELQRDTTSGLKTLAHATGATLYMVSLAAFVALLSRFSGQPDLLIGSPVSSRNRRELRNLIGTLTNILPLRFDLTDDPCFSKLVKRVRDVVLESYAHHELPFEKLIEDLRPARRMDRNPLIQVLFTLYKLPEECWHPRGIRSSFMDFELGRVRCDLELFMLESGQRIHGKFIYSRALFDQDTIENLVASFQILLAGAVSDPQMRFSRLPLLTVATRRRLITQWNMTSREFPREKCIHQLFEKQAADRPDAVAVVFAERNLSYAELNRRANCLAHRLRRLGVSVETPVGICAGQSPEMIVGMLGILKAGGTYVPLDPDNPRERLATLIADARISIVLTRGVYEGDLCGLSDELLSIEDEIVPTAPQDEMNPPCTTTADSLAYIIYSSGSTGEPKGIQIPHRAVVSLVCNSDYLQIQVEDRVAQAANTCFDATTFEVWGALLGGARLVAVPKEVLLSPRTLARQLREDGISVLFLTTALFNLIASQEPKAFASLGSLLFGGEAVNPKWVRQVIEHGSPRRLLHVYGPTENTVFSTWYRVEEVAPDAQTIPIGRPISNTRAYVLDEQLQPLPFGVPGELHLAGDGLARGYLNDPEKSAEKFITDPFATNAGARLYKTGDRVRLLADGQIEYLSRLDKQVKINGFRIEPGEIETMLKCHPLVQEVAVVVQQRTEFPDDKLLVACVVPTQERVPTPGELRSYLKKRLPDYMLPTAFVPLESLPLTASGKVAHELDHGSLEELIRQRQLPAGRVPPTTPLQRRLAEIWQEVLWMDQEVGIHDDFFELGGHSLLAASLVLEIESRLEIDLPLAALFQLSTIAELAGFLETQDSMQALPGEAAYAVIGQKRPSVLVIDISIPYFRRDSGSRRMFELLKIFQSLGYHVLFVADNDIRAEPWSTALEQQGIEALHTIYAAGGRTISIEQQIRERLAQLELAWVCKPGPFGKYAPIIRETPAVKLVYDTIDLHFLRMKRAWEATPEMQQNEAGEAGEAEWRIMREKELANASNADLTVTVSEVEKELLEDCGISRVAVIPNIHTRCEHEPRGFEERDGVLFIGFYKHAPNVDAAVWLCETIMPRVWKLMPDLHVTLLGSMPTTIVKNLASERVSVPGFVEDVGPFFHSHRVFVAPLLYGAGIKGKIGQSLEYALPIVSTSIGTEGMDLVDERDVLVADDAERFAAQILRLYREKALWNQLAANARERLEPYSPEAVQMSMEHLLKRWK